MIIHHLKASGFRIIGESIDTTFPTEGRIGILGPNESGKTTLFHAIECALYGLKKGSGPEADRENLVTWGKNEAKLEIEFTSGQNTYNLQRIFNSKNIHRAILAPVINGVKDRSSAITGLSDVESRIEQITGMDRDSFTKLVYIKQKDLDALKELAKSKREQLVNKVMGIDLFDAASENVKSDSSLIAIEIRGLIPKLEMVKRNKESYESKVAQKALLEKQVEELIPKLEIKQGKLEDEKTLLAKYEWVFNYNSAGDLKCSLEGQLGQVEVDLQKISQLEEQSSKLKVALDTYEPQVTVLTKSIQELSDIERRLKEAEESKQDLQNKKQEAVAKLGLPEKDLKLLSKNLSALKKKNIGFFGATLISGLVCLALAFLLTIFFAAAAIVILILSGYFFSRYMKIDKLATENIGIEATNRQLQEQELKVSTLSGQKSDIASQSQYKTSEEAKNNLNLILSQIKMETEAGSIDGIETLLKNTNQNLGTLKHTNPQARKTSLERQIQAKITEIQVLQKTKPQSVDDVQYSKDQHEMVKHQRESAQGEWNRIKQDIDKNTGTLTQLQKDIEILKTDFDLCPELEKEVQTRQEKIQLLNLVNVQLSETSKDLRNKVLPHARLIINQILPTLTSDRYSDFDISEDLKFKVYSREGGGFKEREIFSGGTQDQFLIALRLAFTQSILDSRVMADKYSLLMDECTSSSDENRKQGIFEVLTAMKQTFSQIFIIAHEDIATYVDNYIVLERNNQGYTEIKSRSWMQ